ncbi:MAG: acetyl-CoA acetyltransferase [Acidimicrobiales bacterium]
MTTGPTSLDPRTPVLVGVGQLDVAEHDASTEVEPVDLMANAARIAASDAGSGRLLDAVDSIRVVALLSWRYRDPGRLLAERLGVTPAHTAVSAMGGNSPQMLVNQAALDIRSGSTDTVLIAGAEAWRTRQGARRSGVELPWTTQDDSVEPAPVLGTELQMSHPVELAHGIAMPVHAYPMFEIALRAAAGRSPADHLVHISELWARFSDVASGNPHAAVRDPMTAAELRTAGPANRWVGYPYTKWLNSNDRVDQSAALVLCSVERAEALGIARERWVFPWSGTDTTEALMSEREHLHRSPAIAVGGTRALELAGVDVDQIAHVDLYSCFPSAVQIGAAELGLSLDRQLTVTGGLTFAGGPWNNYVTHSIAAMAGVLREDPGSIGLCTANGGLISKHAFGVYSTDPPAAGFRHDAPQSEVDAAPGRDVADGYEGPATVETYTVMHGRDGTPETAMAACLTPDGRRAWATSTDSDLMALLVAEEGAGRTGSVADGVLRLD